ncbi:hypothetical protein [Pantanalinema sp. GBBB05]|uniref:hypothetical protein n=1 Tax=Pantanalinema sp. GBBB05 TaxID=2604139 RepID=UPI001DD25BFF|nr:hypothetical protein [Pantanalinema sp. GBBB05]
MNLVWDRSVNNPISHDLPQDNVNTGSFAHNLIAVGESKRSGLILCKEHYAEFAGPGAAVGSSVEQHYTTVIAIGAPEIVEVTTHEDRQRAYSRRIQWVRWLHKIVDHPDPIQRVEKLFAGFDAFFGNEVLANLSDDILARLAGVLPQTVATLRTQHRHFANPNRLEGSVGKANLCIRAIHLEPIGLLAQRPEVPMASIYPSLITALQSLPCPA